jgi:hypothetical protein
LSRRSSDTPTSIPRPSTFIFPSAIYARVVKGFGDAVVTQDASGLDRAAGDGQQAVAAVKAVASIPGLSAERSADAGKLASAIDQILGDARTVYGAVLGGAMTPATQDQMRALASRTGQAKRPWPRRKNSWPVT